MVSLRIAYVDCFAGISGDMLLGALIHAGLDIDELRLELAKLQLPGLTIEAKTQSDCGISGVKVAIASDSRQQLRTLPAIIDILETSTLSSQIIEKAEKIFTALAAAEAKVHNIAIDRVHFHEVGAIDTIVDIVGTLAGLEKLGIMKVVCSPLPLGRGFVNCAHGKLPLPAPVVCELLKNTPTYGVPLEQELVTPTGAALITNLADDYGPLPPMQIHTTGYGAGSQKLEDGRPNLLRLIIGETMAVSESQQVEVIETNIDDWNPEGFPHLFEILFTAGALDVSVCPIQMKKGRPGFRLQVIADPARAHLLKDIVLSETSAIGLRFRTEQRRTLPRKIITVQTSWGEVVAKQIETPRGTIIQPEYEACRKISLTHNIPLQQVYHQIRSTIPGTTDNE